MVLQQSSVNFSENLLKILIIFKHIAMIVEIHFILLVVNGIYILIQIVNVVYLHEYIYEYYYKYLCICLKKFNFSFTFTNNFLLISRKWQ